MTNGKENKKYLYRSQKTEYLAIAQLSKKELSLGDRESYVPLSFKDFIHYGYKFKDEYIATPQKGLEVAKELERMAEHKEENEQKETIFTQLIRLICDVVSNFFAGFGFQTSLTLARELIEALKHQTSEIKIQVPEKPIEPAQSTLPLEKKKPAEAEILEEIGKPVNAQEITFAQGALKNPSDATTEAQPFMKKGSFRPTKPVGSYIRDPFNCTGMFKKIVFRDIKSVEPIAIIEGVADTSSAVGLIILMGGTGKVDLYNKKCMRVVADVLVQCDKGMSDQLAIWLSKEKTFHPALLRMCVTQFMKFEREQKPYSDFALQTLLKTYVDKGWNTLCGEDRKPILPTDHPSIVNGISLLIERYPNDPLTEKLANWMIMQNEFDLEIYTSWMNSFKKREEIKSVGVAMLYPLRDALLSFLEGKPDWKSKLSNGDLAVYLGLKPKPLVVTNASKDDEIQFPKPIIAPQKKPALTKVEPQKPTKSKNTALLAYKQDPINCSIKNRSIIYQEIRSIELLPGNGDNTTTIVGLMNFLSGSETVDLNLPTSQQVVQDVFRYCTKETAAQLTEWLTKHPTYNPALLKASLPVFSESEEKQKAYSVFALEQLLKHYAASGWNEGKGEDLPVLAANDPVITKAFALLIHNQPNNPNTIKLVTWEINQKEFEFATCIEWIGLFMKREKEKFKGHALIYPLRDILFEFLKNNPDWVSGVKFLEKCKDVRPYIFGN